MKKDRYGFTLIELLVVIAIIAILMAILAPALTRVREQAREMTCRANLRQHAIAQAVYLDDFDNQYPTSWNSLVKTEYPVAGYQRYCRWHDPRYPADGPFWKYLPAEGTHLCPSFKVLAKSQGQNHPLHDPANPIVPYYSYSMNAYLGSRTGAEGGGVVRMTEITRAKSDVFFFAEENMWVRPGCSNVLNDNALCPDGRDWFATFHGAPARDLNIGTTNVVFVDAHVDRVKSALKANPSDNSEKEFGRFEKYGWPHKKPYGTQ